MRSDPGFCVCIHQRRGEVRQRQTSWLVVTGSTTSLACSKSISLNALAKLIGLILGQDVRLGRDTKSQPTDISRARSFGYFQTPA